MSVARDDAAAVVDLDHFAVTALPAGDSHSAIRGSANRVAGLRLHIQAGMHGRRTDEGVHTHAEGRGQVDAAGERFADRYIAERAGETLDMIARDADAIDLAVETSRIGAQTSRDE